MNLADGAPAVTERLIPQAVGRLQLRWVRLRVAGHVRSVRPLQADPGDGVQPGVYVGATGVELLGRPRFVRLFGGLPGSADKLLAERVGHRGVGKRSRHHLTVEPHGEVCGDGFVALAAAKFEIAGAGAVAVGETLVPAGFRGYGVSACELG
jgi:hypothetical protein